GWRRSTWTTLTCPTNPSSRRATRSASADTSRSEACLPPVEQPQVLVEVLHQHFAVQRVVPAKRFDDRVLERPAARSLPLCEHRPECHVEQLPARPLVEVRPL